MECGVGPAGGGFKARQDRDTHTAPWMGGERAPRDMARGQWGHDSSGRCMLVGPVCQCGHFLLLGRLAGLQGCQHP